MKSAPFTFSPAGLIPVFECHPRPFPSHSANNPVRYPFMRCFISGSAVEFRKPARVDVSLNSKTEVREAAISRI